MIIGSVCIHYIILVSDIKLISFAQQVAAEQLLRSVILSASKINVHTYTKRRDLIQQVWEANEGVDGLSE